VRIWQRTLDHVTVPPRPLALASPKLRGALVAAVLALGCLVAGGVWGNIHGNLHHRVVAGGAAAGFVLASLVGIRHTANEFARVLAARTGVTHASIVRWLIMVVGYLIATFATLDLLSVPVGHLLLGGALTGIIIGIAAQQSLGNIFAGIVLLLARPFNVGDDIRIRSGALGGELLGAVSGMGLTYVTLVTADGPLSVPNSVLLAAAIGPGKPAAPPAGQSSRSTM